MTKGEASPQLERRILRTFVALFLALQATTLLALLFGVPFTEFDGEIRRTHREVFRSLWSEAEHRKNHVAEWVRDALSDTGRFSRTLLAREETGRLLKASAVALRSPSGSPAWSAVEKTDPYRKLQSLMTLFDTEHRIYAAVRIVDARTGRIVASDHPADLGMNLSADPGFLAVARRGLSESVAIRRNAIRGSLSLVVAHAVEAADGPGTIAVAQTEIDITTLASDVTGADDSLDETGEVILVDSDGLLLLPARFPLADGKTPTPLQTKIPMDIAGDAASGHEGILETTDHRGVRVLAAFRHIRLSPTLGWGLVVKRDLVEANAPIRRVAIIYSAIGGTSALIVAFASLLLARRLTGPLSSLAETARAFGAGSISARASVSRDDEIGLLATTFNEMAGRVEGWHGELNLAVAERTVDLEAANAGMTREIGERRLAEEALGHAYGALAEKNRELEQIVYVASHDLRSPLVNIIGFSRELENAVASLRDTLNGALLPPSLRDNLSAQLDDEIPTSLHFIDAGTRKIDALLSGLLRLSRLGRSAPEIKQLDPGKIASDIIAALSFQIQEAGARVDIGPMPHVMGDETMVGQVLTNLVENALKYRRPGSAPSIRIDGCQKDGIVHLAVADDGIGIDPRHREKVFEIFHRLDPDDTPGEGLGLTIARKIARRLGGDISVESDGAGRGSTFTLSLPAPE